jgi:hypothetical protein
LVSMALLTRQQYYLCPNSRKAKNSQPLGLQKALYGWVQKVSVGEGPRKTLVSQTEKCLAFR